MTVPRQGRAVGNDWIQPEGEDLIVIASTELPKWTATRFRKTAVIVDGSRYYVAEVFERDRGRPRPKEGRGHRYRLSPWPADLFDMPSVTVDYDEAYVASLRVERGSAIRGLSGFALLFPFYPLLGFLPANVKQSLQTHYGVDPTTTTRWSLRCEYLLGVVCLGLTVPQLIFDDPLGVGPFAAPVSAAILLLDGAMRWERMKQPGHVQYGAFEWLFRRL